MYLLVNPDGRKKLVFRHGLRALSARRNDRQKAESAAKQATGKDRARRYAAPVATARIHLLTVAVDRLGPLEVAKRLNVPAVVLNDWIDGQPIPPAKVLELIDLLDSIGAF